MSSIRKDEGELAVTPDGEIPNQYEKKTLRLVGDKMPFSGWLVCVVETAERFSYYGTAGPLRK